MMIIIIIIITTITIIIIIIQSGSQRFWAPEVNKSEISSFISIVVNIQSQL